MPPLAAAPPEKAGSGLKSVLLMLVVACAGAIAIIYLTSKTQKSTISTRLESNSKRVGSAELAHGADLG